MPRNNILEKLKYDSNLFNEERKQSAEELFSFFENIGTATEALNYTLQTLKSIYILEAQNQFSDTQQLNQRMFDKALFTAFKAIFYGMEKNIDNFTNLPIFTDDIRKNTKMLEDWAEENILLINKKLKALKSA